MAAISSAVAAHVPHGVTAVISGGSRGIGKAIGVRFAQAGMSVVVLGKTTVEPADGQIVSGTIHTAAEEMRAAARDAGHMKSQFGAYQLDIRDDVRAQQVAQQIQDDFGSLDVLVNCASAIHLTPTLKTPAKRYDLMHTINARGTFFMAKAAIPFLAQSARKWAAQGGTSDGSGGRSRAVRDATDGGTGGEKEKEARPLFRPHILTLSPPLESFEGLCAQTSRIPRAIRLHQKNQNVMQTSFSSRSPAETAAEVTRSQLTAEGVSAGGRALVQGSRVHMKPDAYAGDKGMFPFDNPGQWLAHVPAYTLSKLNMSMYAVGWAAELGQLKAPVLSNCLWPETTIATAAIELVSGKTNLRASRTVDIMADAALAVVSGTETWNTGQCYTDEEALRLFRPDLVGEEVSDSDAFASYRADPAVVPFVDVFLLPRSARKTE